MKYVINKRIKKIDIQLVILALLIGIVFGLAIVEAATPACHKGSEPLTLICN